MSLNIVFFGTPEPARYVVDFLASQGLRVSAVVTQPDRAIKRSKKPTPPPVKEWALSKNILCFQPEKLSSEEIQKQLIAFDADFFVVVAYGGYLPKKILNMPKFGCVNVHPSALPKYRGAAPIQWALLNGDQQTAISIMDMEMRMDAGDVFLQEFIPIEENQTAGELEEIIWPLAAKLLLKALKERALGVLEGVTQDESQVTLAPKIEKEHCLIDWSKPAREIHNQVRALSPRLGAYTTVSSQGQEKRLKLFRTKVHERFVAGSKPLEIIKDPYLGLLCSDGNFLEFCEIQLEGKRKMTAKELLCGVDLQSLNIIS